MEEEGVKRRNVRSLLLKLVLRRADRVVEQLYRKRPFHQSHLTTIGEETYPILLSRVFANIENLSKSEARTN